MRPILIKNEFKKDMELIKVEKKLIDGFVEEKTTSNIFRGALFPLSGNDYKYMLEGIYKVGSMKLYTDLEISSDTNETEYRVKSDGTVYKIINKKNFPASNLRTYIVEVFKNANTN